MAALNHVLGVVTSLLAFLRLVHASRQNKNLSRVDWLFNVTCNDISVIYVTAHRCEATEEIELRSGSKRHRHFVGFINVPSKRCLTSHATIFQLYMLRHTDVRRTEEN